MSDDTSKPGYTPSVYEAWSAVMAEVSSLAKGDRNEHQKFNFRGIDAVMNAVGPALRNHGVIVLPVEVESGIRDVQTTQGKASREVTALVTYRIIGPAGDHFEGQAPGESMDSGDKATPKAMSVAFRTFLLQALCLPTDEPDPDSESHDRSSGPTDQERAQDTADRAAKNEDPVALKRVADWVEGQGLGNLNVNVKIDGKEVTGTLAGYMLKRIEATTPAEDKVDADAAAEQRVKDSLGATEVAPEAAK